MNTDITEKLKSYVKNNHISYKEIEGRTGMSPSNINIFLNDKDYAITMPLIVRFLVGFRDKDIIDELFEEDPIVANSFVMKPFHKNMLTDGDVMQFHVLFQNAYTNQSPMMLGEINDIFYSLLDANAVKKSNPNVFYPKPDNYSYITINKAKEERNTSNIQPILMNYLQSHYWDIPEQYEHIETLYPQKKLSEYEGFLQSGETITWPDISAFIRNKRLSYDSNEKAINNLNKKMGLSTHVLFRLEAFQTKSYKASDITKIDDFFEMDGKFFAMCLIATRMSMITDLVLVEPKMYAKSMSLDPSDVTPKLDSAFNTFIKLFRNLEQNKEDKPLFESFLINYRGMLMDKEAYQDDMIMYSDSLKSWFYGRDPLTYFPYSSSGDNAHS